MTGSAFHCVWSGTALHVWGEGVLGPSLSAPSFAPVAAGASNDEASAHPFALPADALRAALAQVGEVLWVHDLPAADLTLLLPSDASAPCPSAGNPEGDARLERSPTFRKWRVPTLVFCAGDAVDWLLALANLPHQKALNTGSSRYWLHVLHRVLGLSAASQFAPDLARSGGGGFEGRWRPILSAHHRDAFARLAESLPTVSQAFEGADGSSPKPLDLLESFICAVLDSFVRQTVASDDLAEAVHEQLRHAPSPPLRWLGTLVGEERRLSGTPEEQAEIHDRVRQWLAPLDPSGSTHRFRTLLRLHAPEETDDPPGAEDGVWRLSFHVQSVEKPDVVFGAAQVPSLRPSASLLLDRPIENLAERLQSGLTVAARHFDPLRALIGAPVPPELRLTLREAYHFLRHVTPLLGMEGLGVETPEWWGRRRPRLGLSMRLRPSAPTAVDPIERRREPSGAPSAPGTPSDGTLGIEALVSFDWRLAVGDVHVAPEELRRWVDSGEPLAKTAAGWMEVDADAIREALGFLEQQQPTQMPLIEAMHRALVTEPSPHALPVVEIAGEGWLSGLLGGQSGDSYHLADPPSGFVGTLRPYQLRGVSWMEFLDRHGLGACLADDMGLGKTIQLIALLLRERESGALVGPTLIVVPMSVVGNWLRELNRFAPSLKVMVHHGLERLSGDAFVEEVSRHDVVISTYGLVHRDLEHLRRVVWHRTVLDEAQNIKNPAAKQASAVRRLLARRRVGLTGTPIENRLGELWSIMDFLNPGLLGSGGEFRRVFASPIERHRDDDSSERLRKLIRPFVLRRTKSDPQVDVDLPDKLEMNVFCNLTREQAALYEQVTTQMLERIDLAGGIQRRGLVLTAIMRLKQICNHPAQFLGEPQAAAERSGKSDRLLEMLEEVVAEGDHAIVFTQFRQMGDLLASLLESQLDRPMLFLHGGTPEPKRREIVDQFQKGGAEHPVLILSLKAGGVGLNLTAANHVFHFDRWWNPAVEAQATDRAHRIGQSRKVQVHKFVCVGTLEERIDAMLIHKKDLADRIIGAGEEWLTELTTERLRELFSLSKDAVSD